MKNYSWPSYSKEEISSVAKVLQSNKVNYLFGSKGYEFEKEFSAYTGVKYCLAVANGTLAIDLCLRAIDIKPGDEVIVTSRSFIASASCISALGGIPIFSDVDLNSQNISLNHIKELITKKTKAIICVHFAGFPCNMPEIMKFAKSKKIFVIEDCAQAHGASIDGKSVGTFGHINAWSFCNDKIISTCGEGGMVTSNFKKLFVKAQSFNNHGKNFKKVNSLNQKKVKKFPFVHDSIGLNYRLTEMQSAVGIIQIKKLSKWQIIRNRNAEIYINAFKDLKIVSTPVLPHNYIHAWYKLYLTLNPDFIKPNTSREEIINKINKENIFCTFGSCGSIFNENAFSSLKVDTSNIHNSVFLENNSLILEVHPTIPKKVLLGRAKKVKNILYSFQV